MVYFIILPFYLLALTAQILALLVTGVSSSLRRFFPYALWSLLGSAAGVCAGFVLDIVMVIACLPLFRVLGEEPVARGVGATVILVVGFVAPFPLTVIGFLGGGWLGLRRADRGHLESIGSRESGY